MELDMDISDVPSVSHVKRKIPLGDVSEIALKRRKEIEFQETHSPHKETHNLPLIGDDFDFDEFNEKPKKNDCQIMMQTNSCDKLLELPQVIDVNQYIDSLISVRPYDQTSFGTDNDLDDELQWLHYRSETANGVDDDDADACSEDSNEESNWRNEYPDEDNEKFQERYDYFCQDYPSDDEDFMMSKFERFETNDDDDE